MKYLCSILLVLFLVQTKAQQNTEAIVVTTHPEQKKFELSFTAKNMSDNLLVVVSDNSGETIFLDNKKHFKGIYQKKIDLSAACPGICLVRITNDTERYEYQVERLP